MDKTFHQPLGGNEMPRFGGIATMMRLPHIQSTEEKRQLDAAFVGVPLDIGTSLRSGTRFGPREIRAQSVMIRPYNMATGAAPFDSLNVADMGDVAINTFNLLDAVRIIEEAYDEIVELGIKPLTLGGDHTITLPILRALHKKYGKIGLVHIDAHADVNDHMFGEKAPPSAAPRKKACSTASAWCRLACAPRATPPRTSTGAASRASAWCRPRSAGTSRWSR